MAGRPRHWDRRQAAERAVERFWRTGYGGTSVEDLVAETGLNRFGLYRELGGKKGLFLSACRSYSETARTKWIAPLSATPDPERGLQALFDGLIAAQLRNRCAPPPGCLLANALTEREASADPDICRTVHTHFKEWERAFAAALRRCHGERPSARACAAGARVLLNALLGLLQTARLYPSRPILRGIATRAIRDAISIAHKN